MYKKAFFSICMAILLVPSLAVGVGASAQEQLVGQIIKGSGSTLYYVGSDNQRYVFPNEKTFKSWFDDFSVVEKVSDEKLAELPLAGNVRYRPGALLVKIQTDPRVYAVSRNGILHWITSEQLARTYYGENWNLLVDDVPDTFFVNYNVGNPINDDSDYNPEEEEDTSPTIGDDLGFRHIEHMTHIRQTAQKKQCKWLNRAMERLQHRIDRLDIKIEHIGDDFLNKCLNSVVDDEHNYYSDKKVILCHTPPEEHEDAHTISVGKAAARAHLAHGDTLGACSDAVVAEENVAAPTISNVASEPDTTTATVTWDTDKNATSAVTYAENMFDVASTTMQVSDELLTTSHSIVLTGLTASTTYYFMVTSEDASGNVATST